MSNYAHTYSMKLDKADFDSKLTDLSNAYKHATTEMTGQSHDLLKAKQALTEVERQKNAELVKGTKTVTAVNKEYKNQIAIAKSFVTVETLKNKAHKQNIANLNEQIASTKSLASSNNLLSESAQAEYRERKKTTLALQEKYGITTKAEIAGRRYAQALREIADAERRELITTKEASIARSRANTMRKAEIASMKESVAYRNTTGNAIVRNIRKVESLIVAFYALKKSYDYTLGIGQEFNKMMESEQIGIALSITQKLKDVDVTGKQVTALEKWQYANKLAAKEMEEVRKINVFTPHTLGETIKLYKVISGQVRSAGGDMADSLVITKQLSILAQAGNVEFQSMLKTVDQLFSGKMKASDMQIALQNIVGLTQEETREALKQGNVLEYIKDKLKGVEIAAVDVSKTWGGVTSNFTNAWTDIFATLQKPMFDMMKEEMRDATVYMLQNKDEIIKGFQEFGSAVGSVAKYWDELVVAYLAFSAVSKISSMFALHQEMLLVAGSTQKATLSTMALARAKSMLSAVVSPAGIAVIALTAAYTAYSYIQDKAAEKEERIEKAMRHTKETIKSLEGARLSAAKIGADEGIIESQKEIDDILGSIRLKTQEISVMKEQSWGYSEKHLKTAENEKVLLEASLETVRETQAEQNKQLGLIDKQISAHNENSGAIEFGSTTMSEFTAETYKALAATDKLKYSLINMAENFNSILNEAKVLSGEMTTDAARVNQAQLEYNNTLTKSNALKKELATMRTQTTDNPEDKAAYNKLYETKATELVKVTGELYQKQNDYRKLGNELAEKNLSLEEKSRNQAIKANEIAQRNAGDKLASDNAALAAAQVSYEFEVKRINKNTAGLSSEEKQLKLTEAKLKLDEAKVVNVEKLASASESAAKKSSSHSAKEKAERDRAERELTRTSKAKLETLKEEQKQKLLIAKIEAGVGGLSKTQEQKLSVKFLKQELDAQKKIVKEANKAAKTEKLKEKASEEYTKQLEIQLKLVKAQETAMDKIFANLKDSMSDFSSSFAEGGMGGLGESIKGFAEGALDTMKSDDNPMIMAIGYGVDMLRGLFNTTVSQAEIDAAKGRVEFDDDSLKNLASMFENAQYPMLEVTNKMHNHIRNMDSNFYAIARALNAEASQGGVDLTGVNFVDTMSSGFLGFSSESISLISSGLKFELQNLGDMMNAATLNVKGYTTTLVEESSWWGLSSDSSIKQAFKNLPPSVVEDIADSFSNGYEAILLAGTTLGLNEVNLAKQLKNADINLKEIDFTGLSPSEVSDRLSQAFGTAFTSVIDGIGEFTVLVDRYAKDSEYALETLVRIAMTYDQASHSFNMLGKDFTEGTVTYLKEWSTTTEEVRRSFGRTTGGITTYFSEMATEIYTAQMQILDIVESAGGMDSFNDAMSAFMGNFYTETEQLGFLTKSMEASFSTLKITMPETNEEFRNLLETMDTSTEEGAYLYGQVLLLADGFSQMTKAGDDLAGTSGKITDVIKNIADTWLSDLSYLTLSQKAEYASGYLALAKESNGTISSIDAARLAAETGMKTAKTQEEYIPMFDRLISEITNEIPDATNADIVKAINILTEKVIELEYSTVKVS